MFSVVILTLNEETTLADCLASVGRCDDVLVVDSGSTDRTVEIARSHGARVVNHRFGDFAQQRTFADQHGGLLNPWVFHLDADERFTPELFDECLAWDDPSGVDGAFVAPRMLFRGTWVPRSTDFPAYQARFVHRERFEWIQTGHGQREASSMRMATLRNHYTHEMLAHGEMAWLEKHRRYAWIEAARHATLPRASGSDFRQLAASDPLLRRRALKRLSYSLPARPFFRFVYQFVLRGGVLDGRAGWHYCRLLAHYERFTADALRNRPATATDAVLPAP